MQKIIDKFYLISKNILDSYRTNDYNRTKELIELENNEYKKFVIEEIFSLFDYLFCEMDTLDMLDLENYEVAFYNNDKNLIIRRMYNKVNQIMNRYHRKEHKLLPLAKEFCVVDNNLIIAMQNITGALDDLERKILANIETKYLYFMNSSNSLNDNKKSTIFMNTMYVNPYLEEKLFVPNVMIDKFIKEEDELYYNLWENVKGNYESFIFEYCVDTIVDTIEKMVSKSDSDDNTILRFTYLRSLFNFLDYKTIEEIKEYYLENELKVENPYGEQLASYSFSCIEKDNSIIRKIKTR